MEPETRERGAWQPLGEAPPPTEPGGLLTAPSAARAECIPAPASRPDVPDSQTLFTDHDAATGWMVTCGKVFHKCNKATSD